MLQTIYSNSTQTTVTMINTDVTVIPISKVFYYQNVTDRLLLQYIDTLIEHEILGYQPFVSDVADVATLSPVIPFTPLAASTTPNS